MKAVFLTLSIATLFAVLPTVSASSHREAPMIKYEPSVDGTDLYAFRSPDAPGTVTLIANVNPLSEASNGPNFYSFYDNAVYRIHIDNDGNAGADITYEFRFRTEVRDLTTADYNTGPVLTLNSPNLNERQYYSVKRVVHRKSEEELGKNFQVAPSNIGPRSTPDYPTLAREAVFTLPKNEGRVFAGPRDDPFFVDIGAIVDLATLRPLQSGHALPPQAANAPGVDGLKGFNVHTIALQIPITRLTHNGETPSGLSASNAVIGIYTTITRGDKQVSRLGMPLVNEVVMSRQFKDIFNTTIPDGDEKLFNTVPAFKKLIVDPNLAKGMKKLYGVDVPPAPRNDLVEVFLTGVKGKNQPPKVQPAEMLRLNLAVPVTSPSAINRLGVIAGDLGGFPNGRRLADDVVDAELRVVAGVLVPGYDKAPNNALTDGVDTNDRPFLDTFPYVALPNSAFERGTVRSPR